MHMVALRQTLRPYRDEAELFRTLVELAEPYRGEDALVVFPGLFALGLLAPWRPLGELDGHDIRALGEAYHAVGQRAARHLRLYLVPGTVPVVREDGVGEVAALFGPDGSLLGEQLAVHGTGEAFSGGDVWAPIATPLGTVGLLVGRDAEMPEAARILTLLGAEVLVAPRAPEAPYTAVDALAGLWQLCQQNQTFGVESGLSGEGFAGRWEGKAALFAPCELTPDGSGFLGRTGYLIRDGAVEAEASPADLERIRRQYPLFRHLNPALYRRYFPLLYEGRSG
jgi:predicted amidohydrolase